MSKLNLRIFFMSALFFILPFFTQAAVCDDKTIVDIIARDPDGSFIAKASVDLYVQTVDVDGNKKPGARVAGGVTDSVLGKATLTFKNSATLSASYALRIRTIGKDSASFWYYDNVLGCGETSSITETLSGILVSLHGADGSILTNTKFNIYTQLYDPDGSLLLVKNELLSGFNSGASGQVRVYVPQGSVRSISGKLKDFYVLEVIHSGIKSYKYGIQVADGAMTNIDYSLSTLRVRLKYASGSSASGVQMEVYTQKVDDSNQNQIDKKVGSFTIASNGYGSMEISPGTYALRVKVLNVYQYFWDIDVFEGGTTERLLDLKGSAASTTSPTACSNASKINVSLRDIAGHKAAGLKFEIYEQTTDSAGLPLPGAKMAAGTVNSVGQATVSFKPDSSKNYALKVWDKKADLGEFWYFDVLKFVCGYDRNLTKSLPAFKIVLRDSQGKLKFNYNFSLYAQRYDMDGNPTFSAADLIANLKTGSDGKALVYVSPYNVYRNNQTGYYAISTKDSSGNVKNFYNIKITEDQDYTYEPSFSGLSGEFRNAQEKLLGNKTLNLYEQKAIDGYFNLGKKLLTVKTDANGQFRFEYPSGTYAISTPDDLGRTNIFWNIVIGSASSAKKLTTSLTSFYFNNSSDKPASNITLQLYSLTGQGGTYYRGDMIKAIKLTNNRASLSLAAGAYLISYTGSNNRIFGQAFYAKNGSKFNVEISLNPKYLISDKTSFSLAGADFNAVTSDSVGSSDLDSNSNSNPGSSPSTGSLSSRLKGRILLQVQDKGQAWYLNPADGKRYSLGRPEDAFNVMRQLALGVSNSSFFNIEKNPSAWKNLAGRILLKVEDNGRAYYFDPTNLQLYYLGRPADAFTVMRGRGLGITNTDLSEIAAN